MTKQATPYLTIITPVRNAVAWLRAAAFSLDVQDFPDFEHIIVDGGSTDGSLEVLPGDPRRTVISVPGGLYEALNAGLARARGEIIGWLNADDLLVPGALAKVVAAFAAQPSVISLCGRAELFEEEQTLFHYNDPRDLMLDVHAAMIGNCIPNARFHRREVFDRLGMFMTRWRRVSDREFLLRMVDARMPIMPIEDLICRYRCHPGSLTFAHDAGKVVAFRRELIEFARFAREHYAGDRRIVWKSYSLEGRGLIAIARLKQSGAEGHLFRHPRALATALADFSLTNGRRAVVRPIPARA